MNVLYLDCFSGISGNMMLGALISLGVPEEYIKKELKKLNLDGYDFLVTDVLKNGISAKFVDICIHEHHNCCEHSHHHHAHRHLQEIVKIIDEALLDKSIKENSKKCFYNLAAAEAKVHGTTVDKVHFHEVGAVDTIVDIVGTAIALDYLNIDKVYNSSIRTGKGFINISHGIVPIPAPATAELLNGFSFYHGEIEKELVTPTGAAILKTYSTNSPDMPPDFISSKIGCGAGSWDIEIPNILRVFMGHNKPFAATIVLETNIDDLNPQFYGYIIDKLFAVGALDVWFTPIYMKKNRPAYKLSVLLDEAKLSQIKDLLFAETTTIGLRYYRVERSVLERKVLAIDTQWGQARVKIAHLDEKAIKIFPEYDDIKLMAQKHNIPLKKIWDSVYFKATEMMDG